MNKNNELFNKLKSMIESLSDEQQQELLQLVDKKPTTKRTRKISESIQKIEKIEQKERQCRHEPIVLGKKENKFMTIVDKRGNKIAESCKADSKIDKKLLKGFVPTPRIRDSKLINVKCHKCGKSYKVNTDTILDKDRFTCDKCISR